MSTVHNSTWWVQNEADIQKRTTSGKHADERTTVDDGDSPTKQSPSVIPCKTGVANVSKRDTEMLFRVGRKYISAEQGISERNEMKEQIRTRLDHLRKQNRWVLSPRSKFVKNWDLSMVILMIYISMEAPFAVAFLNVALGFRFVLNRFIDIFFLVDMVMQFFLAYEGEGGELITSGKLMAVRYLRSWFIVDFISIVPFDLISLLSDTGSNQGAGATQMLRMVRVLRLLKLLRVVRASRIITRWEAHMGLSNAMLQLGQFVALMVVVAHW
jgi:hypothetical protein